MMTMMTPGPLPAPGEVLLRAICDGRFLARPSYFGEAVESNGDRMCSTGMAPPGSQSAAISSARLIGWCSSMSDSARNDSSCRTGWSSPVATF